MGIFEDNPHYGETRVPMKARQAPSGKYYVYLFTSTAPNRMAWIKRDKREFDTRQAAEESIT